MFIMLTDMLVGKFIMRVSEIKYVCTGKGCSEITTTDEQHFTVAETVQTINNELFKADYYARL